MSMLIKNIGSLVQVNYDKVEFKKGAGMSELPVLNNAYLYMEKGLISDFGRMEDLDNELKPVETIDAKGRFVLPSYVDTHTHLVFPEYREKEFMLKIKGATYDEIAKNGGGILNSSKKLLEYSEKDLVSSARMRLEEIIKMGTAAVEIKSGYGLSVEGELKMLRVIKKLSESSPVPVKSTFLGAHAVPAEFKNNKEKYIDLILNEMLPNISKEHLADYIDIFIEDGFYTVEDARLILEEGAKYGLKPKIHVDQLSEQGGIKLGVDHNAVSVDHLENTSDHGIELLKDTDTVPTLLPSCSFYLNMKYPPARKMIDKGLGVSIASDYNPGSSPSGNLNFSMSLACIKMKMMPHEAINAVTVNAAFALELQDKMGAVKKGNLANVFITRDIPSLEFIPYSFGNHVVGEVIVNGKKYNDQV